MRYFNDINYICEYRDDGLTKNIDKLYCNSFEGYSLYVKELISYDIPLRTKTKAIMAFGYRGRLNRIPYATLAKIEIKYYIC